MNQIKNQNVNRIISPELAKNSESFDEFCYKDKICIDTAGENWRSLLRIIKLCEIYNVNISLFIAPYISYNNFTNEIDLIRSNIGEDVNFYDFSNSLNDHTQFADPIHINTKRQKYFV